MKNRLLLILIPLSITLSCTPILIAQETFTPPKGIIAQIGKGGIRDVQHSADGNPNRYYQCRHLDIRCNNIATHQRYPQRSEDV